MFFHVATMEKEGGTSATEEGKEEEPCTVDNILDRLERKAKNEAAEFGITTVQLEPVCAGVLETPPRNEKPLKPMKLVLIDEGYVADTKNKVWSLKN